MSKVTENEIAARWAMFGSSPVLRSENREGYENLRNACFAYYRPTDARHWAWIRELVDTQWEIFRQLRYRTAAIERNHDLRMYNWRKQIDPIVEKRKRELSELLPYVAEFDFLQDQVWRLQTHIANLEATIEKLAQPDDAKYSFALEQAAKYVDRLDKWLKNAAARRNTLLKILEYFCRRVDQEIPAAPLLRGQTDETQKIAAPSVVPPDLVIGDITTKDHSETVACASAATHSTNARN